MSGPLLDPEVFRALTDMRPFYRKYHKAKADVKALQKTINFRNRAEAQAYATDQEFIIRTRAEILTISGDALIVILAADYTLAVRLRRRASRAELGAALEADSALLARRTNLAKTSLARAQTKAATSERALDATRQACIAITGYGS